MTKKKQDFKYKVRTVHPNSMRPLTKWHFFMNKEEMLSFRAEWKEWNVEVFEKEKGNWEWSEKYSITS